MHVIDNLPEANRCIRELAALSLLPAIWTGNQPAQIRVHLADALNNSLRADLVYVRGRADPEQSPEPEAAFRSKIFPREIEFSRRVALEADKALGKGGSELNQFCFAGKIIRLAVISLGPDREFGVLAIGSDRADFPTDLERLLLNVSVNHAIIAFRSARQWGILEQSTQALTAAQEELRQHAASLERQIAERTAQLRDTIQELESFSYSVSHDLRAPLRAMQGYSDALLDEFKDKIGRTGEEYLRRIHRSAARMDLLIRDILAYSRVAKGEVQLTVVNVETVIKEVIQNYPALQPDRASITVISPIPPVVGHEAYVTQIVSNLLTNAVKFVAREKNPAITIRGLPEGGMVRISFVDNGIGISPEHLHRIFQIFGRVHSEKQYEGTGIGLAIVKKAAERLGGTVGVNSDPAQGSNFFVLLPGAR